MRINVYSQELTKEVELIWKRDDRGNIHHGVRIYFDGSPRLHHEPDDDDRSAITYWLPNHGGFTKEDLACVFHRAADLIARDGPATADGKPAEVWCLMNDEGHIIPPMDDDGTRAMLCWPTEGEAITGLRHQERTYPGLKGYHLVRLR